MDNFTVHKVVVVGGAGFIGGHLVDRLADLGYDVHVVDNMSTGHYINSNAKYHLIDIGDCHIDDLVQVIENSHCIFHLAAKARVQPSFEDPIGYHRTNVNGTLNLLEACRLSGVKNFVFSSSSSVYGNYHDYDPFEEWDDLSPDSPYAFQKKIGEEYCKYYWSKYNLDIKVLRYFNVYGDRMIAGGQYAQAIQIFLNNYKKNEPFNVFGDGEQRRDFTHVSDVVEANVLAMNYVSNMSHSIFNIGTGTNYSVNELCSLINTDNKINYLPAKSEPKFTLASTRNVERYLNWKAKIKLPEWIKERI